MRTPTMRTPSRGQRGRNPTPLPSRPVRGGPKITEKPRIQKTPPKPRPTKTGPYGGRVPKRVKETPSAIKKTPSNTGTSTKTAQAALIAAQQAKLANKALNQKQPTGSRAAALRRRKRSGVGLAGALRRARSR